MVPLAVRVVFTTLDNFDNVISSGENCWDVCHVGLGLNTRKTYFKTR